MDNSYTVLIVDDEAIERKAIRMTLESSHLPLSLTYEASSGREMLETVKNHSIDIIILDINMPGLSGLQALEMLRAEGKDTKVIISTAYDEFNFAVKALQSGAVDFLVKPVEDETLIESVKKSMERLDEEKAKEEKLSRIEDYLKVNSSSIDLGGEEGYPETVRQICSYIEANYDKRIGLDEIARDCSYSKFHLARLFKSVMNMTLVDAVVEDAAGTVASAGLKIALRDDGPLSETLPLKIRFSEVDSMSVVWHGSYVKYFEDAREAFGARYGLGYMDIFGNGYYAPLVELDFKYRKPLLYGSKPEVTIFYRPTEAAKIVFDYEIRDTSDGSLAATGHSVQVFMDKEYKLVWTNPPFYEEWKKRWKVF